MIELDGNSLLFSDILPISEGKKIKITPKAKEKIDQSQQIIDKILKKDSPIYGINTGFGYLANTQIEEKDLSTLNNNILKSHAGGYGPSLSLEEIRLAMVLRLNSFSKGFSGVSYNLCEAFLKLIEAKIYPVIPEYGSVGASGDLLPLAHLALPLIGEGEVFYKGEKIKAIEALKKEKIKPIYLLKKEGLGLINGTQIMLAVGGLALANAENLLRKAELVASLSFEALMVNPLVLDSKIHQAREQEGQITVAKNMLKALEGSYLCEPNQKFLYLQAPYSLRCAPQVYGASRDSFEYAKKIVERELNAATDNPLVFTKEEQIISGGNFHGQPLALAFDFVSMAISEVANLSERRLEQLLNPHLSKLPPFLAPNPGINSGLMGLQYLSASYVNENKLQATPSCTDSIPGNVGIEDHVSMGMTSARSLRKIVKNTEIVLALEMVAASQAIDLRKVAPLGKQTKKIYNKLRESIPIVENDIILYELVEKAVQIFRDNKF